MNRREALSIHRAELRRTVEAMVPGDPRMPRRSVRAVPIGIVVALLAAGAALLVGRLAPGGPVLRTDATIIDRASGARFVLIDHVLRPVRNVTSARLIAGPGIQVVDHAVLAGIRRGTEVGLSGVPDSVPVPADLVAAAAGLVAGGAAPVPPAGRDALVRSAPSGYADLCLLTDAGICLPIPDAEALRRLGYAQAPIIVLPPDVIVAYPHGPELSRSAALAGAG